MMSEMNKKDTSLWVSFFMQNNKMINIFFFLLKNEIFVKFYKKVMKFSCFPQRFFKNIRA